jgi:hypothetical protein
MCMRACHPLRLCEDFLHACTCHTQSRSFLALCIADYTLLSSFCYSRYRTSYSLQAPGAPGVNACHLITSLVTSMVTSSMLLPKLEKQSSNGLALVKTALGRNMTTLVSNALCISHTHGMKCELNLYSHVPHTSFCSHVVQGSQTLASVWLEVRP